MTVTNSPQSNDLAGAPAKSHESQWIGSQPMADQLGNHVVTLRNLRRIKNGPFKQGRDYRFSGAGRGRLQWNRVNAEASFTEWQRPAEVELFQRDVIAVQR
mgnify:FL=1